MMEPDPIRSDRDLQDALITYLADAKLRRTACAQLPLLPEEAKRAGRFARFLARRYYRDRLARSFRFSRGFGPAAEMIADTPIFDAFLDECVLGSLASAEHAARLALDHLSALAPPGAWWGDLLQYERLFFLQAATTENVIPANFPQPGRSSRCHRFSWDLPQLIVRLKAGEPIGNQFCQQTSLVFSRTHLGRIYVVEVDEATAAIFHAADGSRSLDQIAAGTSLPAAIVQQTVAALTQIGALAAPSQL